MLFLSPGIVYCKLCSTGVIAMQYFVVDVSTVYVTSCSEDGKKQNQSVHTHTAFPKIFRVVHGKKDKKMP